MEHTGHRSDDVIQSEVVQELKWDPAIDDSDIGVHVQDGTVTLIGSTVKFAAKLAAQRAARRVLGARDIANQIVVKGVHRGARDEHAGVNDTSGADTPGRFIPTRDDTEIAHAVRHALEWDVFVHQEHIQSAVSKGWVMLTGAVPRVAEREDAERAVRSLDGVLGVSNEIIVSGAKADPDEVRRAISLALSQRAAYETSRIDVNVMDDAVYLTGPVHNLGEKEAIVAVVQQAPGVSQVMDRLQVQADLP